VNQWLHDVVAGSGECRGDESWPRIRARCVESCRFLGPEDQETLAILHDPPGWKSCYAGHETLAEVEAAGIVSGMGGPLVETDLSQPPLLGLRVFPAVLDELAGLPPRCETPSCRCICHYCWRHPRRVWRSPSCFRVCGFTICTVDGIDYRMVYQIDGPEAGIRC